MRTSGSLPGHSDRPLQALAWMAASGMGFAGMAIFVKRLAPSIPQFELVFARSLVNFLIVLVMMLLSGENLFPPGKALLIFRGIAGLGSIICYFHTISTLPLAIAGMLAFCSSLFVILMSRLFLKEKLSRSSLFWVGTSFLGLAVLLQPDTSRPIALSGGLIGLLGAALGGTAYVAVRAATARAGVNAIILYFMATSTLISAPLAARDFVVPGPKEALELLMVGVLASVAQFTMTHAYRLAPAGMVSAMSLLSAAFAALFGWVLFDERVAAVQWLGIVILAVSLVLLTQGQRPGKPPTKSAAPR